MNITTKKWLNRRIPLIGTIQTYNKEKARRDLIAGFTVAIVAVPQTMAYAIIAGLDPVYGLYTAIVASIIASIFGSSNFLIAGPTNAVALLIASNMSVFSDRTNFYEMIFLMTFIVGVLQILFGVIKLGKLINYVSHSVIVGFTAGAGIIIALGQLGAFTGISVSKNLHSTMEKVYYVFTHIEKTNLYALGIGILTIVIIQILKKVNSNIPGSLIAIIISSIIVVVFGLDKYGVKLTGKIPTNLPPFKMVVFDLQVIKEVFPAAFTIAIIGLVEAISIAKAMATKAGQKIDTDQEFIAQGLANLIPSFFQSFAGTGSFCRSGVNFVSGAATRVSGILSGTFVALILLFFGRYAMYIPTPALAGVIITIGYSMVDKKEIKKIFKFGKSDLLTLIITSVATVILPEVSTAVLLGVIVSLVLYLKNTGNAQVSIIIPSEDGFERSQETKQLTGTTFTDTTIIQLEGNLYFGCSADLESKFDILLSESRVYMICMRKVSDIDITALDIIKHFSSNAIKSGSHVIIYDVQERIYNTMKRFGVISQIGDGNIFRADDVISTSYDKAMKKSETLQNCRPEQQSVDVNCSLCH